MHCEQRQGKCFECGQAGHVSRYCPRKTSPAPSVALAPTTPGHYGEAPLVAISAGRAMEPRQPEMTRSALSGQVFAAQAEEPIEAEERNVVAGATHSFISRPFAQMHGIDIQLSRSTWRVEAPERAFVIRKECLACPVQVGHWIMLTRLLVLKRLKNFDIILGMDWLSRYYVTIDCKDKLITFREPGQKEFTY
ncbi:uncharacterized protein LOC109718053 [Ananas comosus]|uniref:Uncharacterized protein LOC109718053 n=1 Tax=Ananas comosus TaxID=4615 RepID=A0A6P5FUN0_ANACO|nr:uncharacterized protein LOC109718053 [Ananas comosus]